jgi:hypothetical protein
LISSPEATASILDTTGSFPISLLAKIVRLRIIKRHGPGEQDKAVEAAEGILRRVAINRVFDVEGIMEVISDLAGDREARPVAGGRSTAGTGRKQPRDGVGHGTAALPTVPKEKVVEDSQADEDEISDMDEEVEEAIILSQREPSQTGKDKTESTAPSGSETNEKTKQSHSTGETEIIIIDNLTTAIGTLFSRTERKAAHALLQNLSCTLTTHCRTTGTLALLLNSTLPISTYRKPRPAHPDDHTPNKRTRPSRLTLSPSVFSSCPIRPALGRVFADFCTLHLMISPVPKTARDAAILHASTTSSHRCRGAQDEDDAEDWPNATLLRGGVDPKQKEKQKVGKVNHAHIVEVLHDSAPDYNAWIGHGALPRKKRKDRVQRWAPFVVSPDGLGLVDAFPDITSRQRVSEGGRRTRNESGANQAVQAMHLVKQFPFGRRAGT